MIPRVPLIAALVLIEIAIIGGAVVSVRGFSSSWSQSHEARAATSGESLVHETFDAGSHPVVIVNVGFADVTFTTRNAAQVDVSVSHSEMHGLLGRSAPITARKDGDTLTVSTPLGESWSPLGDDRMVTILVPPEARVSVLRGGDIRAAGLRADATLTSAGNGTVTVEDFSAARLHIDASNGHVTLHRVVAAQLDVASRNGRVEGSALNVRNGTIESNNGRVTLGFAPGTDTLVTATTSNGSVRLSGFPSGTAAGWSSKKSGGDDDNDDDDGSSKTVRVGAGNGRLDVQSSNGSINLRQEG